MSVFNVAMRTTLLKKLAEDAAFVGFARRRRQMEGITVEEQARSWASIWTAWSGCRCVVYPGGATVSETWGPSPGTSASGRTCWPTCCGPRHEVYFAEPFVHEVQRLISAGDDHHDTPKGP